MTCFSFYKLKTQQFYPQLFWKFHYIFDKFAKAAKNTEIKNLYKNEDNMRSKMFEQQSEANPVKPNYAVALILISIMIMFVSGCITLGKNFPEANVSSITIE